MGAGFLSSEAPEFKALNPNALVPVFRDGALILWESNTICRYLAAKYGPNDLLPVDPFGRAVVEQWMDWQATELNTSWRYAFMALLRRNAAYTDPLAVAESYLQLESKYGNPGGAAILHGCVRCWEYFHTRGCYCRPRYSSLVHDTDGEAGDTGRSGLL